MDEWDAGDESAVELTPYPIGLEEVSARSRRRSRIGMGASVVAVVLLLGGLVALRRDAPGRPDLVEHDDAEVAESTIPDPSVPETVAAEELGYGSPIDGKQSLLLPVRVTPDTDLVAGQRVKVTASGFAPNVSVAAVTCTIDAVHAGVAACDIFSNFEYGTTDSNGNVTIDYTFQRFIDVGTTRVDCQLGNVDPVQFGARQTGGVKPLIPAGAWTGCLVAVGRPDDYDQSGGWPVLMRGATPLPIPDAPTGQTVPPTTAPATTVAPSAPTSAPPTTTVPTTRTTSAPPPTTFPPGVHPGSSVVGGS